MFLTFPLSGSKWHFRFAADIVADVTARTLTAETPSYVTIMELDKKVREFPMPEGYSSSSSDFGLSVQQCILDHIRETSGHSFNISLPNLILTISVLMVIHRSFFAQAIIDQPENPLKSQYAPSFLAAYRASSIVLRSISQQFNVWPNSTSRFWFMWTSALSAGVHCLSFACVLFIDANVWQIVFGTIVTHGPRSPLAQPAMSELEKACALFSKASVYSVRASKALVSRLCLHFPVNHTLTFSSQQILTKLREKAQSALVAVKTDSNTSDNVTLWKIKEAVVDDELSIFAGHTRFVSVKKSVAKHQLDANAKLYAPHSSQSRLPAIDGSSAPDRSSFETAQPQQVLPAPVVNNWLPQIGDARQKEDFMLLLPRADFSRSQPASYPRVPSEHSHQAELSTSYGWSNQPPQEPASSETLLHHLRHYPDTRSSAAHGAVSHQLGHLHYDLHPQGPIPLHLQPQPLQYSQHLPPNQHHRQDQSQGQGPNCDDYTTAHTFNSELVDLGLTSRDSWLDERWSSLMQDSGLLEGIDFRVH